MTIALGYKCLNGVVVAADTLVISSNDYEAQEGSKLSEFWVPCGSFAVVHASNDAHATVDLLGEIHHALESATPAGYRELGIIIKQQMKTWSDGFGRRKPPASSLVFAAKLKGLAAKLFRCDPPNTFIEHDDYTAVGYGAGVTDPLYHLLFGHDGGKHTPVQTLLRRVAYLMYCAKKGNALCGKRTHAAVVWRDDLKPTLVRSTDMESAEKRSVGLDFLFSSTALFALQEGEELIRHNAKGLATMLEGLASLRATKFFNPYGDEITLEGNHQ